MPNQYSYRTVEEQFMAHVNKRGPDDCWPWTGTKDEDGYGLLKVNNMKVRAHRLAFKIAKGSIDPDLLVLHSCEDRYPPGDISSRACCNDAHLSQGTNADNTRQRDERGRASKGDRHFSRTHPEKLARGDSNWAHAHPEKLRRGEESSRAKLKTVDVLEIRSRYQQGGVSQSALAAEYGVSQESISSLIRGGSWAHLPLSPTESQPLAGSPS